MPVTVRDFTLMSNSLQSLVRRTSQLIHVSNHGVLFKTTTAEEADDLVAYGFIYPTEDGYTLTSLGELEIEDNI